MRRLGWLVARTLLIAAASAGGMVGIGQLYSLSTATCSSICQPEVAAPLGALAGLLISAMLPSARWSPLEDESAD